GSPRSAQGPAMLPLLWAALRALPRHGGQRDPRSGGQGTPASHPSPPLPPRLFVQRAARHHYPPPRAPCDPQGHPRRLHLGRGLARPVPLLPPQLSPPGRVADPGPGFVAGDLDRWLAPPAAAV